MSGVFEQDPPSVWRSRDFRIAWLAGFINDLGDWVLNVALPVYVFTETKSGTATAVLFVLRLVVAAVLGPIGGSLVDRWNLRRCVITTNLAQAVMLLPLLFVSQSRIWPAYIVVVGQAVLSQFNNPANFALLPRLVLRDQLTAANAALSASRSAARFVGSPLGGIIVAVGGLVPIVAIDMVSFLAVAMAVVFIRANTDPVDTEASSTPRGVRQGLRVIAARPRLVALLVGLGIAQLAQGGFLVLYLVFVVESLGGGGTEVGVIRGSMAIGAVIGAALIGRYGTRLDPMSLLAIGYIGLGVGSLLFWNSPQLTTAIWLYLILISVTGVPASALEVGLFTTIQSSTPAAALGRVIGVLMAVEAVGAALGSILAGVLVDVAPLGALLNVQGSLPIVSGILVLVAMRRWNADEILST